MLRDHNNRTVIRGLQITRGPHTTQELDLEFVVNLGEVQINVVLHPQPGTKGRTRRFSLLFEPPTIRHITFSVGRAIRDVLMQTPVRM